MCDPKWYVTPRIAVVIYVVRWSSSPIQDFYLFLPLPHNVYTYSRGNDRAFLRHIQVTSRQFAEFSHSSLTRDSWVCLSVDNAKKATKVCILDMDVPAVFELHKGTCLQCNGRNLS